MTDPQTHNANTVHSNLQAFLLSPLGIRTRAQQIYQLALDGGTHFKIHEGKLHEVTAFVLSVIESNYPDRQVPYHSRWRHFEVGNHFQLKRFNERRKNLDALDKARMGLDLILPSVLVDAGAGPDWVYSSENSLKVGRSEGLALASLDMFLAGGFSHTGQIETTATGLCSMSTVSAQQSTRLTTPNRSINCLLSTFQGSSFSTSSTVFAPGDCLKTYAR